MPITKFTFLSLHKTLLRFSCRNEQKRLFSNQAKVKEIKIPTKWGHIAGKLWGNETQRPILALHGWQDNAGTWDPLAPILAKYCPILAIDLPGHGFSSWYPPGMHYHFWDWPPLIQYVKEYFQWSEITILAHSISACSALRYVSLFPDEVKAFVAIDALFYSNPSQFAYSITKFLETQKYYLSEPPPCSFEFIKRKWHVATSKSVNEENIIYLAKRGVNPSTSPSGGFYVNRDPRLNYMLFPTEDLEQLKKVFSKMNVPTLYIRASRTIYSHRSESVNIEEYLKRNNDRFEVVTVEGTHHAHLNSPEIVAPPILNFFSKYDVIDFEVDSNLSVKENI